MVNSLSNLFGESASRLEHMQETGMLRGCQLAFRNERAVGETD